MQDKQWVLRSWRPAASLTYSQENEPSVCFQGDSGRLFQATRAAAAGRLLPTPRRQFHSLECLLCERERTSVIAGADRPLPTHSRRSVKTVAELKNALLNV